MSRTTLIALSAAILTVIFVALPNSANAYDGYVYQDAVDRDYWLYDVYDRPVYYIPDYRCGFHGGCGFRVTRDFLPGYHREPVRGRIEQKEQFLYEQQLNNGLQNGLQSDQPKRLDSSPPINQPGEKVNEQPQLKSQPLPSPQNQPLLPPVPAPEKLNFEKGNNGELKTGLAFPKLMLPQPNRLSS